MKNTKLPLTTRPVRGTSLTEIRNADDYWVATVRWPDTADRIAACMNACGGYTIEQIEEYASTGGFHAVSAKNFIEFMAVCRQRDELLAELLRVKEICLSECGLGIVNEVVIASVKGTAA